MDPNAQIAGATVGQVGWAGPDPNPPKKVTPPNANAVAMNKLKQKNRKRRKHTFTVPFNLTLEAATVFTLTGFAAGFDGAWLLMDTEHRLQGRAASTTRLDMEKCLDY
jgi:hypothetical protein